MISTLRQNYSRDQIKKNEMGGEGGTSDGTEEVHTQFWWEDVREREELEGLVVDGRIILKCIFNQGDGEAWTEFVWLRDGTGGGNL